MMEGKNLLYFYMAVIVVTYLVIYIITSLIYKKFIPYMKEKKMGQIVRKEGMETHLKKQGTPTMGGIVFGLIFVASGALYTLIKTILKQNYIDVKYVLILSIFAFCLLVIGYKDDITKITLKNTDGLSARKKLIYQILSSIMFVIILLILRMNFKYNTYIKIPFVSMIIKNIVLDYNNIFLIIVWAVINVFILVGTQNGVNFTDGIDSLLANVTIVVAIFYLIESLLKLAIGLFMINLITIALLFSFRKYNKYPAQIFMGDTGSLMLGAYVGGMALLLDIQYYLPIYGFIYMIEVISVILQVSYYKITKGKRIFKMAPIHHHFEKCGWSEKKVVKVFTIITVLLCAGCVILLLH